MGPIMFDAECDLAALVYGPDQDPDAVMRDFAAGLNARGFRAVGMVQAGQCADSSLSAVLVHNGETMLLAQDSDPAAKGCRLDVSRLHSAAEAMPRIARFMTPPICLAPNIPANQTPHKPMQLS